MLPRPFYSIGLLFREGAGDKPAFLGTCFGFRTRSHLLTAAHCVGNLATHELRVLLPVIDDDGFLEVEDVIRHPDADLAILRVAAIEESDYAPFYGIDAPMTWGEKVQALGYPEESEADGPVPTARLLTGHVQRFFTHDAREPYVYKACELSFGAPAGLSGGPLYWPGDVGTVVGVIADNHDSTTYLQAVEQIQADGSVFKQLTHELIRYGIAVHLPPLRVWLDSHVPLA